MKRIIRKYRVFAYRYLSIRFREKVYRLDRMALVVIGIMILFTSFPVMVLKIYRPIND